MGVGKLWNSKAGGWNGLGAARGMELGAEVNGRTGRAAFEQYPHMCRDGHQQIGHRDSEHEMCPLCRALAKIAALRAKLRWCHDLLQKAESFTDCDVEWRWGAAVVAELLACDEAGECPTIAAAPLPTDASEREAFEKWAHGERLDVTRIAPDGCEHYPSGETATAWLSWQAARALPAAPAPQPWTEGALISALTRTEMNRYQAERVALIVLAGQVEDSNRRLGEDATYEVLSAFIKERE